MVILSGSLGPPLSQMDTGIRLRVKKAQIPLGVGHLPPKEYTVYIFPTPKYIWGIDILQGLWLQTTAGEFRLRVRVVKAVLRGHARHPPIALPVPQRVTNTKQYKLPGGHKEIGETLQELEKWVL